MIRDEPISVVATSVPDLGEIRRAWLYSRPNEVELNDDQIFSTDVPVHEFARFTVEMRIPILLREWLVSFRDHVIWARTSRVDDLTQWGVFRKEAHNYQARYDALIADMGQNQDHFRNHLPLGYMTGLSASLSFRSWIKLLLSAKQVADEGARQDRAVWNMFVEFYNQLSSCIMFPEILRLKRIAFKAFKPEQPLRDPSDYVAFNHSQQVGGMFYGSLKAVPLTLRAQMARHRPLVLRDGLMGLIQRPGILAEPMDTSIDVEFMCSIEVAHALAVKRNCWIAQEDLWAPVIRLINESRGTPILPCTAGPCTAVRDNELRKAGQDPAPPCPRFAALAGERFTADQTKAARDYLPLRPITRDYWEDQINAVSL